MLKKIAQFYSRHKKLSILFVAILVVTIYIKFPQIAYAEEAAKTPDQILQEVNSYFNIGLKFASSLLWPVLLMIGSLLDNDLIFGGAMGEKLRVVWVEIRNLVNIIFVLILLAIAVYNVLGLGQEGGGLPLAFKSALPKFVLALIAVNFSFIGVKVILDFTNVITGAVFALPSSAISDQTSFSKQIEESICGSPSKEVPYKALWCEQADASHSFNERARGFFSRLDRSNIAVVYAIRFGKAVNLKFIRDDVKDLAQLGFNIIFNAVLFIVYALSFIALFLVLLARLVVLWVVVVMSPFMALTIVLPNLEQLGGEGGKIKDLFVKNAIAPIKIGLVLSVGYIMLDAFQADTSNVGQILASSSLSAIDPNALPTDIGDLQQLLVAVAIVVIVWKGVFSAAGETSAGFITDKIKEYGQAAGGFVSKLPMYAQLIPTGGKFGRNAASVQELLSTGSKMKSDFEQKYGSSLTGNRHAEVSEDVLRGFSSQNRTMRDIAKYLEKNPEMINHPEGMKKIQEAILATKFGGKKEEYDKSNYAGLKHDQYAAFSREFAKEDAAKNAKFDADKAIAAIEKKQTAAAPPAGETNTPATIVANHKNTNGTKVSRDPAFSAIASNPAAANAYASFLEDPALSPAVKEEILRLDNEGKVIPDTAAVISSKRAAAKRLVAQFKADVSDEQIIRTKVSVERDNLPTNVIQIIVKNSGLSEGHKVLALEAYNNPTTPPPAGTPPSGGSAPTAP